jgi:hypothetical protein
MQRRQGMEQGKITASFPAQKNTEMEQKHNKEQRACN